MEGLRLKAICVLAAIVIGVTGGLFVSSSRKFREVYVKIDPAASVSIYKNKGRANTPQYNHGSKPLFHLTSSGKVKLKYGSYASVLSDPGHVYKEPVSLIKVGQNTTTITIDESYSAQKLASLLPAAKIQVAKVLDSAYSQSAGTYTITKDGLYEQGNWYGAVVTPQNPAQDTVRIILHETDGNWSMATSPNITIGKPSNPNIPAGVIEAVDQL